jgi:hypothetical protein
MGRTVNYISSVFISYTNVFGPITVLAIDSLTVPEMDGRPPTKLKVTNILFRRPKAAPN